MEKLHGQESDSEEDESDEDEDDESDESDEEEDSNDNKETKQKKKKKKPARFDGDTHILQCPQFKNPSSTCKSSCGDNGVVENNEKNGGSNEAIGDVQKSQQLQQQEQNLGEQEQLQQQPQEDQQLQSPESPPEASNENCTVTSTAVSFDKAQMKLNVWDTSIGVKTKSFCLGYEPLVMAFVDEAQLLVLNSKKSCFCLLHLEEGRVVWQSKERVVTRHLVSGQNNRCVVVKETNEFVFMDERNNLKIYSVETGM